MLDRIPFNLLKQSNNGNGNIGEHKQRECENIKDFLIPAAMNLFPFGGGCYRAYCKKSKIHIKNAFAK